MPTYFISDLHLSAERPEMSALFESFLRRLRGGDTLYILGDLFEAWLGDDAVLPEQAGPVEALRTLTGRGIPAFFMHGNRDFLAGEGFEAMTGCRLLPDPSVVVLGGEHVLLMHGDTLCTDDHDYQAYRARVRDPDFIRHMLSLSVAERRAMADHYRTESHRATRSKPVEIMDVNQQAVEEAMREHNVTRLIHGHTHRPGVHDFKLDGRAAQRIVLGDWYNHGSALVHDHNGYRMERIDAGHLDRPSRP